VAVALQSIDLAAEQLKEAQDRYAAEVSGTLEVVQSQEAVASANETYIQALYLNNVAKLSLVACFGCGRTTDANVSGRKIKVAELVKVHDMDEAKKENGRPSSRRRTRSKKDRAAGYFVRTVGQVGVVWWPSWWWQVVLLSGTILPFANPRTIPRSTVTSIRIGRAYFRNGSESPARRQ